MLANQQPTWKRGGAGKSNVKKRNGDDTSFPEEDRIQNIVILYVFGK
jgi:hypothetical protein